MTSLGQRIARLSGRSPELRAVDRMTDAELSDVLRAGLGIMRAPPLTDIERATRIADLLSRAVERKEGI